MCEGQHRVAKCCPFVKAFMASARDCAKGGCARSFSQQSVGGRHSRISMCMYASDQARVPTSLVDDLDAECDGRSFWERPKLLGRV